MSFYRWQLHVNVNDIHCITTPARKTETFFFFWLKNLISWKLEQGMLYNKKKYSLCCGLWHKDFYIFQRRDGLLLRGFVHTNNLCVWERQRNSVRGSYIGYILCFSDRSLEELEGKHSYLRRELVTVKENLSQLTLQKEVLEDDKASLALALSKVE